MKHVPENIDVLVVGGGHAGIEATLAANRMGMKGCLVTMDKKAVGRMSCNPAIGGIAKGQMVREIDVLGGVMGLAADNSGLQFKILNRSKGKSVWSPRAQVDKRVYEKYVNNRINNTKEITVVEGEVVRLLLRNFKVVGVVLRNNVRIYTQAVVLTCGTFLNGLIHIGERKIRAGRMGEPGAEGLTEFLVSLGLVSGRLKTGTPPRLIADSIDWTKTTVACGDKKPTPFSYRTMAFSPPDVPCHTIKTNALCHDIIYNDLDRSPMFSGDVSGVGPRYCPSIEDKIYRFAHREEHALFLEPEWFNSKQIYTNGFSTSLPEKTQLKALRAVAGLENVEFYRPGYAIEYDFFPPAQLKSSLETKNIKGLFFAGQINGTSGYEEAAAQGLVAGANAANRIMNREPLLFGRDEAYIGVLIDDLVTKDTLEPYRMFTSRAEYRILIRYSNAGDRLAKKAFEQGLITEKLYEKIAGYFQISKKTVNALNAPLTPDDINPLLLRLGEKPIKQKCSAKEILKRPVINIHHLPVCSIEKNYHDLPSYFIDEMMMEAEITVKYDGYIKRHLKQLERIQKQENKHIPESFDYLQVSSLSNEAREKLSFVRPETLGQALRVSGVTPADASVLAVYLSR
ncbi:MAG: tRNA uridine-5-carboxymethylaminomethyl(34) synthesis enzyme MnmG [Candidatus Marinimicrobia bacterium]|nr:tRNA uridine-5-carboxymethylaminomethyl(34) synthesis enzyme MnmG [Candidatus Neomarinimicrobiota bacterium]HJL74365.1 tRNA uridine-5-carboxymethylaminomethyl(34) synthesis enzyme MnmG [Candidatus Neomarinimicrobiota bacterium]